VLLDNAYDAQQVRPLLPGGPGCFAVITSRDQFGNMIAREAAQGITLDPLGVADARELLARRLGTARVHAEPDAVADLISSAAGVPLALSVIAAKAVKRPAPSLRTLAEQMRSTRPPPKCARRSRPLAFPACWRRVPHSGIGAGTAGRATITSRRVFGCDNLLAARSARLP
jgi:hypothetical protein